MAPIASWTKCTPAEYDALLLVGMMYEYDRVAMRHPELADACNARIAELDAELHEVVHAAVKR